MTDVYLIRHGDFVERKENGLYMDCGLSELGRRQVQQLSERIRSQKEIRADVLYASTLPRAIQSAAIIAPVLGKTVEKNADLEEWRQSDGTLNSEEMNALRRKIPESQRPYYKWQPSSECAMDFSVRVHLAMNSIVEKDSGKSIVIVCHGGVVQASFSYFFNTDGNTFTLSAPLDIKHTAITHWQEPERDSGWVLERLNDYSHLL